MASEKETKKVTKKRSTRKKSAAKVVVKESEPMKEKTVLVRKENNSNHPYGTIAHNVSLACVVITGLVILISPSSAWILGPIIGAMAIFGIALGYFSSK